MNIICYGDSNTYGYDPRSYIGDRYPEDERWPEILMHMTGWCVQNEGMNGRGIQNTSLLIHPNTDLCIIMLGTNDLLQGADAQQAAKRMEVLLKKLPLDKEKIMLVSPPAFRFGSWVSNETLIDQSYQLSEEYQKLAQLLGIHFADSQKWDISIGFDGVHFTPEGHQNFAKQIYSTLSDLFFHI